MARHDDTQILALNCMVLSISNTRTEKTDQAGNCISRILEESGHQVKFKQIIKDKKEDIRKMIDAGAENPEVDAIIMNGGTGLSTNDVTIETLDDMLEKEIHGFGELFRMLCYQEIASAAILVRAKAGVRRHTAIFSIPGTENAVDLAMNKIIMPELEHICYEIKKDMNVEKI
ncbi:MogA/MoaB family molybdenum cofactor biosynthesis protein [Oceanobacillus polygoni]|uniref:Molybdenum cofactor biosynthesis protein B n=1 Tax=Oceanobacillus polygoni TaxID=1235259 RepID=A0A9X0YSK0_9BACI|nr:molybdenum cofactor biosynthesis protein B [Oceanobacillus polygoni]MBP2077332.1 molybdenum cofactor biosynthesis protein B [Oceanobacillus polygoni]